MSMNSLQFSKATSASALIALGLSALILVAPTSMAASAVEAALDDQRCGPLAPPGQYGPYDYRTATIEQKHLVEGAHFSRENELLIRGTSQDRPGPDIDYTLRAFPNHPRALKSVMDLAAREKTPKPFGTRYTTECWFNRAIRFAPDDAQVRMVYGLFLMRAGQKQAAVEQLEVARTLGLSSGNFNYNLGLAYFQAQEYDKARLQAYKARELGYELDGLKNLLTKAGKWQEPPPTKGPPPVAPDAVSSESAPPAKN